MFDNYNLIELLEDFTPVDDILKDIINDIQKYDIITGVKVG